MIIIDKLAYSSKLRYRNPILKVFFAISALTICVAARLFVISILMLVVMSGLTVFYSRTSIMTYIKLMCIPLGFILLSTIAIVVNITDNPLDLLSISVGSKYLAVSYNSLTEGARLIMVALSSVSCLFFLTLTTPMIDILTVLRRFHCPIIIVELMMLMYRYIFVILDMASAITTSQNCRLGNKDFMTELRSIGQMLAVLLVRSLNKASNLYISMESRCYDGELRVLNEYYKASKGETIAVSGFLIIMLSITVFCKSQGGVL